MAAGLLALLLAPAVFAQAHCPCDCNDDGQVGVDEITTGVGIALGRIATEQCLSSDSGGDGSVGIADLIGGVDALLHGCPHTLQRAELEKHRELWDHGARLPSHQYRLFRGCFCPPPNIIDVTVVNRELREILDPDTGQPIKNLDPTFPVTIDDLFDLLDDAIDHADLVRVDYDPVLGAPIQIAIDYQIEAVDDELSFLVEDLRDYGGGECRDSGDCDSFGSQCIEPGGFVGCGICDDRTNECSLDDDCAGGTVCRRQPKLSCPSCDGEPIYTCQDRCVSNDECRDGEVCGVDGHCSVVHCLTHADCDLYFDCSLPTNARTATCERRSCVADIDCSDGFCVGGKCYDRLGRCEIIPP